MDWTLSIVRYFANNLNNQLRVVTVLLNDVISTIFFPVWLLLLIIFAAENVELLVTGREIGLKEACGAEYRTRSSKDYELPTDYCDEALCRFEGEASPRKHVACVKDDVR